MIWWFFSWRLGSDGFQMGLESHHRIVKKPLSFLWDNGSDCHGFDRNKLWETSAFWLTDTAEQAVLNTLNNKERPKSVALFSSIYGSNFMYKNKV